MEEGDRVVEVAEGGVGALELEHEDGVVVEAATEECGVDLEKVVRGFGVVFPDIPLTCHLRKTVLQIL